MSAAAGMRVETCVGCGRPFEQERKRGRPRDYCDDCSGRSQDPADPPVRRDGRCAVCRKPRLVVAVAHGDPFCRMDCCRVWYGIELGAVEPDVSREAA